MGRAKTPSFIITRRILAEDVSARDFLDTQFNTGNRLYNRGSSYFNSRLDELNNDAWYCYAYQKMKETDDEDARKVWVNEVAACQEAYGITEYGVHAVFEEIRNREFPGALNADIIQKLGSSLYASLKKAVYHKTKVHYRKYGNTNSLEGKKANTGIIYYPKNDTVRILGRMFSLKPVRNKDFWMMEALTHRVKYCRVVRKPSGIRYHYFLQMVMEGSAPDKIIPGTGACGLDPGVSTGAFVAEKNADFYVLADGIEEYEKEIRYWGTVYDRRRRMANPQCYHDDGRIRKGNRFTVHTKGMKRALMKLKSAYAKKSAFIKNKHGFLTNRILEECDCIITEPMDYRALSRRSRKKAERSSKASRVHRKGKISFICKFRRKKRFGSSILRRAPGMFSSLLQKKAAKYGVDFIEVDIRKYRASQYDHVSDTYKKCGLSARTKKVGGHMVQRDLYSAFLLKNYDTPENPDRSLCRAGFRQFLKQQGTVVGSAVKNGDPTGNFGLKDFLGTRSIA